MPTLLNLMSGAAADAGIVQPGQTPSSGVGQPFILEKFNEMVRSWSAYRLRLNYVPEATYPLSGGVSSYEIGPAAANFPSGSYVKPVYVEAGVVIIGTSFRKPLNMLTAPQWAVNANRGLTHADGPIDFFYNVGTAIGTFNVAPAPAGSMSMILTQWNPLQTFAIGDVAENIEDYYPQEYLKPLRLGLAMELSPAYRLKPGVDALFAEAIGIVEKLNNDKLSGSFGTTRTLDGPVKGQGAPVAQ